MEPLQAAYMQKHSLPVVFERLLTAVIIAKPAVGGPLADFVAAEAGRLADASYVAAQPQRDVSSVEETDAYLAAARVVELLETLCAATLAAQPTAPLAFIADECVRCRGGAILPCTLFDDTDFHTMHRLSASPAGEISGEQVTAALKTLGLPWSSDQGGIEVRDARELGMHHDCLIRT